tara:strand:- start:214 stop:1050 length:837 start_codon:yes stop_codon:yes gene_type:complete
MNKISFLIISFLIFSIGCNNYDDEIKSLNDSISLLEEINAEQTNLISGLQAQIDELKKKQQEDRLAAEGYVENAITSISQLTLIVNELSSNFINQAANIALIKVDIQKLENNISSINTQLDLIDSTGDISEINDLLNGIRNEINQNSQSIVNLISRVSSLEIESDKYSSEIVGCYTSGVFDHTVKFLNNGLGYMDFYEQQGIYQVFIWEKKDDLTVLIYFGDTKYELFQNGNGYNGYLYSGTQTATLDFSGGVLSAIYGLMIETVSNGLMESILSRGC